MPAVILQVIKNYSKVKFAVKNKEKIAGAITFIICAFLMICTLVISMPTIIMQSILPGSEKTNALQSFAMLDVESTEREKSGFIAKLLSDLSTEDESAEFIGDEPSKEEIIIVYITKYGEVFDKKELDKSKVRKITRSFLRISGLKVIAIPFEEAIEKQGLTEEQKAVALNMYKVLMYDQTQLERFDPNYEHRDFGKIIYKNGQTNVNYFSQRDIRWAGEMYGDTTVEKTACGPTCLAMAITTFTNMNVTPLDIARWSYEHGYKSKGGGSYWSLIPEGGNAFGLHVKGGVTSGQEIVDALAEGKLVIAIMGAGHFTSSGHFIVLRGITEEGKVLVADPYTDKFNDRKWDMNLILREVKGGRSAGGPFWIIGGMEE